MDKRTSIAERLSKVVDNKPSHEQVKSEKLESLKKLQLVEQSVVKNNTVVPIEDKPVSQSKEISSTTISLSKTTIDQIDFCSKYFKITKTKLIRLIIDEYGRV